MTGDTGNPSEGSSGNWMKGVADEIKKCLPSNLSPDLYFLQTFRPNSSRPALLLQNYIPNFEIRFQIPNS